MKKTITSYKPVAVNAARLASIIRGYFATTCPTIPAQAVAHQHDRVTVNWTDGPSLIGVRSLFAWAQVTAAETVPGPVGLSTVPDGLVREALSALARDAGTLWAGNIHLAFSRHYTLEAWDLVAKEIRRQRGVIVHRTPGGAVIDLDGTDACGGTWLCCGEHTVGGTRYWDNTARLWLDHTDLIGQTTPQC